MDFSLSDDQQTIADLARQILGDKVTHEILRDLEKRGDPIFVPEAWDELAKADLLGIALPEAVGGNGYGLVEACIVLREVGRTVAPVPYLASIVEAAMPIAEFGSRAQQREWLPGVIDGSVILTAALAEEGNYVAPSVPATTATPVAGGGWSISGEKLFVPAADRASRVLVPARTPDGGTLVALVDPRAPGASTELLLTTSGTGEFILTLDASVVGPDDLVGDPSTGDQIVQWIVDRATIGVCAMQSGVCEAALKLTATYTSEREQFGSPIATFQAVAHRAADAYIDANGVTLTMWLAAWRLANGLPAADEIDVAKFWAAEGGQRMIHACQHLHGGIGVDIDYPLHRYFRWSKQLELTLGAATEHLRLLGSRLAAVPV